MGVKLSCPDVPMPRSAAAAIAVPLPTKIPVAEVVSVIAGVVVGLATVPAKPLAEATETVVTVPVPVAATQDGLAAAPPDWSRLPELPGARTDQAEAPR